MEIPLTATLTISYDCPACQGNGYTHYLQCSYLGCYRNYTTEPDTQALEAAVAGPSTTLMPCGHEWRYLEDTHPCSECEGEKTITQYITLAELAQILRGAA